MFEAVFNMFIFLALISILAQLAGHGMQERAERRAFLKLFKAIEGQLDRIEELLNPVEEQAVTFEFFEIIDGELIGVKDMVQSIEDVKKYKVMARDKAGNEAKLDGAAEVSITDPALADIVMNEDGSFDVAPKGPIGDAKLQVKADALIGEGVEDIFGEADFSFVAGKAVAIEIVPV